MTTKIPTLLGLGILTAGIVLGVFLVSNNQIFKTKASPSQVPEGVSVSNISANSVSISWQTADPTTGFVRIGQTDSLDQSFADDRDSATPRKHQLHFITLTHLVPETIYHYQISSGPTTYPSSGTLSFKTAPTSPPGTLQPLIGSIVDSTLQPIEEALVLLAIPNQPVLSTISKVSGNFILPLTLLRLGPALSTVSAKLKIQGPNQRSEVTLPIPFSDTTLPPFILGQDLDLTPKKASAAAEMLSKYDLNSDGVINSLDLSIVISNIGKKLFDKRADLNNDGTVDQKDINLINQFIPHNSAR